MSWGNAVNYVNRYIAYIMDKKLGKNSWDIYYLLPVKYMSFIT